MFFTAMSYASMSRAFPMAGSVYSYVQRGLHEAAGFFAGWLILLDYILVPALLYIFAAVALRPLLPAVPGWVWLVVFVGFNAVVNLIGVQLTARFNRYILVLELLTLALFMALGVAALYGGPAGGLTLKPVYDPAVFTIATVAGATSIAVLSFLGFDGISTLAEESRGGLGAVARATLLALLLVGVLFIAQTWIATDLARGMHFSSSETAFYEVAERAGGVWLRNLTLLVNGVVAGAIANAMVAQAAVSRILFAMARDRKLPALLAKVHPRYQTPYVSTLVVATISVAVGLFFAKRVDDLSRVVNFGALTSFLLLHVSVIHHFFLRQRSGDWLRHLLLPLGGLVVIGYVLYEMDKTAKLLGVCWIAVGILYYALLVFVMRRPVSLEV
jgi:amino acid transporter